jgi:hypothetical protein
MSRGAAHRGSRRAADRVLVRSLCAALDVHSGYPARWLPMEPAIIGRVANVIEPAFDDAAARIFGVVIGYARAGRAGAWSTADRVSTVGAG